MSRRRVADVTPENLSGPAGSVLGMAHPVWCARHSAACCRSTAAVIPLRLGKLGVQLEAWAGRETALVLLPEDAPPIYLPAGAVVELLAVVGGLAGQAGWATPLRGQQLLTPLREPLP